LNRSSITSNWPQTESKLLVIRNAGTKPNCSGFWLIAICHLLIGLVFKDHTARTLRRRGSVADSEGRIKCENTTDVAKRPQGISWIFGAADSQGTYKMPLTETRHPEPASPPNRATPNRSRYSAAVPNTGGAAGGVCSAALNGYPESRRADPRTTTGQQPMGHLSCRIRRETRIRARLYQGPLQARFWLVGVACAFSAR
jgi:hypothetical protein